MLSTVLSIELEIEESNINYSILKSGESYYAQLDNDETLFQITSAQYEIINQQIDRLK
jgi:hypothetical protein